MFVRALMRLIPAALLAAAAPAAAKTILFVGNSFTYGGHSAAWKYRADTVTDLNKGGVGGVPALFKRFADELGLDYQVSLETGGGKPLDWHWAEKRALVDRAWDQVVLQDYSTLDRASPGDPGELIDYSRRFAGLFAARNPGVRITLTATWSRPDQTFLAGGHWFGHSILDMGRELDAGYRRAAEDPRIAGVAPVGLAFNCAIIGGVADPNPYDGTSFGQLDLWTYDHYHASTAGYYLEALVLLAKLTGRDPRALGEGELAAADLGLSKPQAAALQRIAWQTVDQGCGG